MINFFKYSKTFLFISFLLIFGSFISIYFKGFNYGIDFKGGTLVQIFYDEKDEIDAKQINLLKQNFEKNDLKLFIQTFISDNKRLLLKISDNNNNESHDLKSNIKSSQKEENFIFFKKLIIDSFELKLKDKKNIVFEKIEFIGAKTGKDFFFKSSLAILFAFIGIFIYLYFRFNLSFTIAGLICLLHDIILSFGFISITQIEFNLIFITAVLTIIGYSINDSVIIFDRIRELLKMKKNMCNLKELINLALNNTLKRTIFTSLTTLFACISLIIFAGKDLFSFSIPVFFGILIGTYSSIMISCQFIFLIQMKKFQ
jgi:preprotein translocase subunit SecF